MHKYTAIFFVFLYLIAMLRPVQPYVEYIINQDYIAEFLCINKDKPQLHCNGKCYIAKQLKNQQEKEPLSSLKIALENYPIGFVSVFKFSFSEVFIVSKEKQNTYYQRLYSFNYKSNDFKPPDSL